MENKLSVIFFKTSCSDARECVFGDVDKNIELYLFASTKKLAALQIITGLYGVSAGFPLGWFKNTVSSQTEKLIAGTKFSDYLGLNH